MGLNIGTLVRPYTSGDSDSSDGSVGFTCTGPDLNVCVGIITEFDDPGKEFKPCIVLARVNWYKECSLHKERIVRRSAKGRHLWYVTDDLWEIGQVY